MKAIRGYFKQRIETNLDNNKVSSLKMLLFDCLPRRHRSIFNNSSFTCLKRSTEYRLFEEGMRKYEDEINIVRLIRDQRWILSAVKKLMSEKSGEYRKEVHQKAQQKKLVQLQPQMSIKTEINTKDLDLSAIVGDEILDNEEESSLDISEESDDSDIVTQTSVP